MSSPTQTTDDRRFHRFRHYPGVWSTFDMIEPCAKPKRCMGCQYHHPFCTETGRVSVEEVKRTDPLVTRLYDVRR
jgi:hypothetical protein